VSVVDLRAQAMPEAHDELQARLLRDAEALKAFYHEQGIDPGLLSEALFRLAPTCVEQRASLSAASGLTAIFRSRRAWWVPERYKMAEYAVKPLGGDWPETVADVNRRVKLPAHQSAGRILWNSPGKFDRGAEDWSRTPSCDATH